MRIIDPHHLLSHAQTALLHSSVALPFVLGKYRSLDDILVSLKVDVIIEPGIVTRPIPPELKEAEKYWEDKVRRLKRQRDYEDIHVTSDEEEEAIMNQNIIRGELESWGAMPLRGLYEPTRNVIRLYPEEMITEYSGKRMDELLVSTLAHETMHAYFNRPGHEKFPYVIHVEEPLAEFGMLLYLYETSSSYYSWAYADVSGNVTCYKYGAKLMDQHLTASTTPSPERKYLEDYKILLPVYAMHKPTLIQREAVVAATCFDFDKRTVTVHIKVKEKKILDLTRRNVALAEAMIAHDSKYARSGNRTAGPAKNYKGSTAYWMTQLYNYLQSFYGKKVSATVTVVKDTVTKAVEAVDRENSTHLNADGVGRKELTKRIMDTILYNNLFDILRDRKKGFKFIEDLAELTHPTSPKHSPRSNYSFATKFCHYACFYFFEGKEEQDNYSKYDKVMAEALPMYLEAAGIKKANGSLYTEKDYNTVANYSLYSDLIDQLRDNRISRCGFDHLLWYYHKAK